MPWGCCLNAVSTLAFLSELSPVGGLTGGFVKNLMKDLHAGPGEETTSDWKDLTDAERAHAGPLFLGISSFLAY